MTEAEVISKILPNPSPLKLSMSAFDVGFNVVRQQSFNVVRQQSTGKHAPQNQAAKQALKAPSSAI